MKNYANHPLADLIDDADRNHLGYVVKMGYDIVTVLTNDEWKHRCNGVPQNSFLVATSFDPANFSKANESQRTVILLRVRGPKELPKDGDTFQAIIEHYQRKRQIQAPDQLDGIELVTRSRLQFSGLECHILGTFFTDNTGKLFMGSDVEDFYAIGGLRVYKPTARALGEIVNFIAPNRLAKAENDAKLLLGSLPRPIPIGTVRYTSANPMQRASREQVMVRIQPLDFLARRTAVFGMTRTGKSNTVKTTVASVATVAKEAKVKVGQVIFDIKGEYANANGKDDGSSLAEALGSDVVRYRALEKDGFLDLRDNFYKSLTSGLLTLQSLLKSSGSNTGSDMGTLLSLSLDDPDPEKYDDQGRLKADLKRLQKRRAIYKAILFKAGLPISTGDDSASFEIGKAVWDQLHKRDSIIGSNCDQNCINEAQRVQHAKRVLGDPSTGALNLEQIGALLTKITVANRESKLLSSTGADWIDETEKGLLNILLGESDNRTPIRSTRVIGNVIRIWHSKTGALPIKCLLPIKDAACP